MVWSATFFGIAVICGVFAYGEGPMPSAPGSELLFFVFLGLSALTILREWIKDRD